MITRNVSDAQGFNEITYRNGNCGRNTLMRPRFNNWDFLVMKDFAMTEKYTLQFRFESFNLASNPRSRSFGLITNAREMRTNLFALILIFWPRLADPRAADRGGGNPLGCPRLHHFCRRGIRLATRTEDRPPVWEDTGRLTS